MNMAVNEDNFGGYLKELSRIKVDRIFIALEREPLYLTGKEQSVYLDRLKRNRELFMKNGYQVGVWFNAYGFGTPLSGKLIKNTENFVRIKSVVGAQHPCCDAICPEEKNFVDLYADLVVKIAKLGFDMIMLDDDFCLSVRPGLGCFCDSHLKLLEDELGEKLDFNNLKKLIFTGGENKYRNAWLKVMGETNAKFAKIVRNAVDSVNKSIRIGFCAGFSSWDIEGIDAIELTKILAGNNKPFLRFTGAPYWVAKPVNRFRGQSLAGVIEDARAQEAYSSGSGVEVFIENDSYPRPRYMTPSSLIESFALAMRASSGVGELSYLMDYVSSPEYETGYMDHRLYNMPLYKFIDKNFDNKTCVGVKIFNQMHKIQKQEIPEHFSEYDILASHFNRGAEFLAVNGVPTCYGEGADYGAAFGEDARYIKSFCKKMVVDAKAAKILSEQGYDLGFESMEVCPTPKFERMGDEKALLTYSICVNGYFKFNLKDSAAVLSEFDSDNERFPASYKYCSNGVEFLVLCFDVNIVPHQSAVLRSYFRAKQLHDFFTGLPKINKSNCLYQICKKGDGETAILFINLSENPIINGEIILDDYYSELKTCFVDAELKGCKITIKSFVAPYAAFALLLKK